MIVVVFFLVAMDAVVLGRLHCRDREGFEGLLTSKKSDLCTPVAPRGLSTELYGHGTIDQSCIRAKIHFDVDVKLGLVFALEGPLSHQVLLLSTWLIVVVAVTVIW